MIKYNLGISTIISIKTITNPATKAKPYYATIVGYGVAIAFINNRDG